MPKAPATKVSLRTEDEILDQATRQLLRAVKEDARKKGKPIAEESLRRDGHSERFIDKIREA